MEGTSRATRPTRVSIRSTSIAIDFTTKVVDEVVASSDSNLDDVYVAHVSSSGDEFDHDEE